MPNNNMNKCRFCKSSKLVGVELITNQNLVGYLCKKCGKITIFEFIEKIVFSEENMDYDKRWWLFWKN